MQIESWKMDTERYVAPIIEVSDAELTELAVTINVTAGTAEVRFRLGMTKKDRRLDLVMNETELAQTIENLIKAQNNINAGGRR